MSDLSADEHARMVAKAIDEATPYDRIEDFAHPKGRTRSSCFACGNVFRGHPYRSSCRICATTDPTS